MEKLKQKLSSRKLWIAVVGIVVGLAAAFGIEENDYAQVAGMVTSAVSVIGYIFGEAKVDAVRERAKNDCEIAEGGRCDGSLVASVPNANGA